eukprot:CAMPEP_0167743592 /NCGR_PEP_ID=MMETSP0110_2-20121227/2102_1 /TAXON_ID=629695 /ORGANISM="Gymnochlora sp., Strain CCMP2014" /LENGTH=193 /DNA_ID=CAMNT_0007627981 /DNA_START=14 /DNA_END=595 /DNA_ORIENTATION=+
MAVYGFLLHDPKFSKSRGNSEDKVVIWACRFYNAEGNDKYSCARAKAVAMRVHQEYSVSKCELHLEDKKGLLKQSGATSSEEQGIFRLKKGKLFSKPKSVIWIQKSEALCTLICEEEANILLAASQLKLLMNAIIEQFGAESFRSAKWINQRPEELYMLLDRLLPCGHLQFLTETDIKKEVSELAASLQKGMK